MRVLRGEYHEYGASGFQLQYFLDFLALCDTWAMSLAEVKRTIEQLSPEDQAPLAAWLEQRALEAWDQQITSDFSAGGPGLELLAEVDAEIATGNFDL
jgi:hypothetical protein